MKVIRGGIYKVSNAWKKYNDALLDHRPVIVVQRNEEFVYGVLMGALPREAKHKNALYFECEVSGKEDRDHRVDEQQHKIPIRYIKDNLGLYFHTHICGRFVIKRKSILHLKKVYDRRF